MDQSVGNAVPETRTLRVGGTIWLVYEHTPKYDRRQSATLVFESPDAVRRVREFPADWRRLSDEELYALSWGR